jgi:hypothetical protein
MCLWSCPTAKDIWSRCGNKIQKRSTENEEFVYILEELLHFSGKEDIKLMAVVARMLWIRRNALVYGKKVSPSSSVIGCASESSEAFQLANSQKDRPIERVNTKNVQWEAPKNDFVKINWDAAGAIVEGRCVLVWLLEMVKERCWQLW